MSPDKIKLTDAAVARAVLPSGKTEGVIWDSDVTGFGLRLRGGKKTYIVAYRPPGAGRSANTKRLRLGTPESISTAAEARRLARAALGQVAAGLDVAAEREKVRRKETTKVVDLLDRYELDLKRRNYVARSMVMSLLRSRLKPHVDRDIKELKSADFANIVEKLERAKLPGAAEAFRSRCRAFLSWCLVKAKAIEHNPLYGYRRERATRSDRLARGQHGRALADTELAAGWNAASPEATSGRFVRFLILTGCRRGEGAGLTRSMLDAQGAMLELPASFVKQARSHSVPVSPALLEILNASPIDGRSDLFFPSSRTGGQMSGWNTLAAALVKRSGVSFTFHDLRRSFRTGLSRLKVDTDLAELCLGHARADLETRYDRHGFREELREAFQLWSDHVEKIVAAADPEPVAASGAELLARKDAAGIRVGVFG